MAVRLRNNGPEEASLVVTRGPNAIGCFTILNALRPIPAANGGTSTIFVQFAPSTDGTRTEIINLKSPSHGKEFFIRLQVGNDGVRLLVNTTIYSICAYAQGEGVKCALEMDPAHGKLDFGNVLEGRSMVQSFKLKNVSPFTLRFDLRQVTEVHENLSHMLPFQVHKDTHIFIVLFFSNSE